MQSGVTCYWAVSGDTSQLPVSQPDVNNKTLQALNLVKCMCN
jgi:hypothetical protein